MNIRERIRSGILRARNLLVVIVQKVHGRTTSHEEAFPRTLKLLGPVDCHDAATEGEAAAGGSDSPPGCPYRRSRATLTRAQVSELARKVRQYPPANDLEATLTKQEAIRQLRPAIALLQRRGYSLDAVADWLTQQGLSISTPTLKSYLHRIEQRRRGSRRAGLPLVLRDLRARGVAARATPIVGDSDDADPFGTPHET